MTYNFCTSQMCVQILSRSREPEKSICSREGPGEHLVSHALEQGPGQEELPELGEEARLGDKQRDELKTTR